MRKDAAPAFADCIDQLKQVLEQDVKSAEALALQSACYGELAKERHLEAVLLRSRAEERLRSRLRARAAQSARALSARHGRIRRGRSPDSPENQRAFAELQHRAQLFDQSSATRIDVPGWGHAEAYLALGMQLQSRGDMLGARNWIEKSLIVAPDLQGGATANGDAGAALIGTDPRAAGASNLVSCGAMKPQGTQLSLFETRSSGDAFAVRVSARARRLTARVHVGGRVEIVVPVGVKARAVRDFVQRFTPWIDRKVAAMQCFAEPAAAVPARIEFAYTAGAFRGGMAAKPRGASYRSGGHRLVGARARRRSMRA